MMTMGVTALIFALLLRRLERSERIGLEHPTSQKKA